MVTTQQQLRAMNLQSKNLYSPTSTIKQEAYSNLISEQQLKEQQAQDLQSRIDKLQSKIKSKKSRKKYEKEINKLEKEYNTLQKETVNTGKNISITRAGFEASKESLEPAKKALLSQGALRTSGINALEKRKEILKPIRDLTQSEESFETDVGKKAPEYAKPEYRDKALSEAVTSIQAKIDKFRNDLDKWEQREKSGRDLDDSDKQERKEDKKEFNFWSDYLEKVNSGDSKEINKVITEYHSGYADAKIESKIDQSRASFDNRQKLKAMGIVDDRTYLKDASGKFVSEDEYKKANPWYKGTSSLPTGSVFFKDNTQYKTQAPVQQVSAQQVTTPNYAITGYEVELANGAKLSTTNPYAYASQGIVNATPVYSDKTVQQVEVENILKSNLNKLGATLPEKKIIVPKVESNKFIENIKEVSSIILPSAISNIITGKKVTVNDAILSNVGMNTFNTKESANFIYSKIPEDAKNKIEQFGETTIGQFSEFGRLKVGDQLQRAGTGQIDTVLLDPEEDTYYLKKGNETIKLTGRETAFTDAKNLLTEQRVNELISQGYVLEKATIAKYNPFNILLGKSYKTRETITKENLADAFFNIFNVKNDGINTTYNNGFEQNKFETLKLFGGKVDTGIEGDYAKNTALGLFVEKLANQEATKEIEIQTEASPFLFAGELNRQKEKLGINNLDITSPEYEKKMDLAYAIAGGYTSSEITKRQKNVLEKWEPALSNYSQGYQRTKQLTTDIGTGTILAIPAFAGGVALGAASKAVPFLSKAVNTYFLASGVSQAPEIISAFKQNPLASMAQTIPWTYFGIGQTVGPRLSYNKNFIDMTNTKRGLRNMATVISEQQKSLWLDKRGKVSAGNVGKAVVTSQAPSSLLPDIKSPFYIVKAGKVGNVAAGLESSAKKNVVLRNLKTTENYVNFLGERVSQKFLDVAVIPAYNKIIKSTAFKKEVGKGLILGPNEISRSTARIIPTVEIKGKNYGILSDKISFGGGVDIIKRGENVKKAAIREFGEETGIKLKEKDLINLGEVMLQPEEKASFFTINLNKALNKNKLTKENVINYFNLKSDVKGKEIRLIDLEKINKGNKYKKISLEQPRKVGTGFLFNFKRTRPTELFVLSHIDELTRATQKAEGIIAPKKLQTAKNVLSREIGRKQVSLLGDKEIIRQYYASKEMGGLPTIEMIQVPTGKDIAVGITSIYPDYSQAKALELLEGKRIKKIRYKKSEVLLPTEEMLITGQSKEGINKLKISEAKDRAIYNLGTEFAGGDITSGLFGVLEKRRIIESKQRGAVPGKYVTPSAKGYRILSSNYVLGGGESSGISFLPRFASRSIEYGKAVLNKDVTNFMIDLMKSGKNKKQIINESMKIYKPNNAAITPKTLAHEFEQIFTVGTDIGFKNKGAIAMEGKFVNIREARILKRNKAEKILKLQEKMYEAERKGDITTKENIASTIEKETGINPIDYINQIENERISERSYESILGKQLKATTQIKDRKYKESEITFKEPKQTFLEPSIKIKETKINIPEPNIALSENRLFIKEPSIKIKETKINIPEPSINIPETKITLPEPEIFIPEQRLTIPETKIIIPEPNIKVPEPLIFFKKEIYPSKRYEPLRTQKIQSYSTQVKRRGKWESLFGGKEMERSQAIKLGEKETRSSLAATFRIVKGKKLIEGIEKKYNPSEDIFRDYSEKGNKKIRLQDTWIQKQKRRFDKPSEYRSAQSKRFKTKFNGGVKWL